MGELKTWYSGVLEVVLVCTDVDQNVVAGFGVVVDEENAFKVYPEVGWFR